MLSAIVKITVLMWSDVLAVYAMWMMMSYLTNVWDLGYIHAAGIVNVFWGVVMMLPVVTQFLVDTLMGNFWMLVLSSFAYSAGLGFLSMSTPPVLSGAMGTCSGYNSECIGEGQKILFYTALVLTAFGMAGHLTSIGGFLQEQIAETEQPEQPSCCAFGLFFMGFFAVVLVPVAGAIALPYIKPWAIRFGIPAICSVVATLIFLSGMCSYRYGRPQGSPLSTIIRVIVGATSKIFHRPPRDSNELYETRDYGLHLEPHSRSLRCLDKAAIILPDQTLEQQKENRWRLCRLTEVEETKCVLRMIPMCTTFIMLGVVSSIGFTYFIEQADKMNRKVGRLSVPLPLLLWFYDSAKSLFANWFATSASCFGESGARKYAPSIGIAISHIFAILCCITAAKVENRRLDVVIRHGLIDRPDDKIPMSMFWLLPQFVLLGGLDGVSYISISAFVADQVPPSMAGYMGLLAIGTFGLGIMGGVLSVYILGVISEKGGKPNWFQHTLNRSRLDKYYWTLAAMTAVNLVIFILVAVLYAYRDSSSEEDNEEVEFEETAEPFEDNARCCC